MSFLESFRNVSELAESLLRAIYADRCASSRGRLEKYLTGGIGLSLLPVRRVGTDGSPSRDASLRPPPATGPDQAQTGLHPGPWDLQDSSNSNLC